MEYQIAYQTVYRIAHISELSDEFSKHRLVTHRPSVGTLEFPSFSMKIQC